MRRRVRDFPVLLGALALALSTAIACDRRGSATEEAAAGTTQRLVGVWRESGGQSREYAFDAGGAFTMKMNPAGCSDAAGGAMTTASGTWSVREKILVLDVKTTSDPILSGSTMRDTIRDIDGATLVLESSLAACAGQRVRLSKQ